MQALVLVCGTINAPALSNHILCTTHRGRGSHRCAQDNRCTFPPFIKLRRLRHSPRMGSPRLPSSTSALRSTCTCLCTRKSSSKLRIPSPAAPAPAAASSGPSPASCRSRSLSARTAAAWGPARGCTGALSEPCGSGDTGSTSVRGGEWWKVGEVSVAECACEHVVSWLRHTDANQSPVESHLRHAHVFQSLEAQGQHARVPAHVCRGEGKHAVRGGVRHCTAMHAPAKC